MIEDSFTELTFARIQGLFCPLSLGWMIAGKVAKAHHYACRWFSIVDQKSSALSSASSSAFSSSTCHYPMVEMHLYPALLVCCTSPLPHEDDESDVVVRARAWIARFSCDTSGTVPLLRDVMSSVTMLHSNL